MLTRPMGAVLATKLIGRTSMSTNASITAKTSDGKWVSIYLHYDGYISSAGKILTACYNTQERVDLLMQLGDLSTLGPYCGCPLEHTWENPIRHYCIAYHRDRKEALSRSTSSDAGHAWKNGPGGQQYNYIWDGEAWCVGNPYYLENRTVLEIGQLDVAPEPVYNLLTHTAQE